MAITSTGFDDRVTDKRVGLKSSVYDKIILIGAEETPLMKMIGTSPVRAIEHSWIIDSISEPKKNAQLEISDFVGTGKSTKQKRTNSVQIFTTEVMVSETMQSVATYGGKELEQEVSKKAKEHKKDIEYSLFGLARDTDVKKSVFKNPTLRDETAPGEMAGIFHYVAKNSNAFTSGKRGNVLAFDENGDWSGTATKLTEEKLNQILQQIWDSGATPKDVFIGAKLKSAINAFATRQFGNEKMINAASTVW